MARVDDLLAEKFHAALRNHGAMPAAVDVWRRAVSPAEIRRTAIRLSCSNCGYTEVYNLRTLEGKDNLSTFRHLFAG